MNDLPQFIGDQGQGILDFVKEQENIEKKIFEKVMQQRLSQYSANDPASV